MNKLSIVQQRAFNRLREVPGKWYSPYELKESIATLDSLHTRDLVEKRCPMGSMAFPRNSTLYRAKQ